MSIQEQMPHTYVSPGMPPLTLGKRFSFFEFWPTWLMYIPVVCQWLALALKYRSLTLPLIANPKLPLSGMVGVPKSQLLSQAQGELQQQILPWFTVIRTEDALEVQVGNLEQVLKTHHIQYPFVGKPDIGCRGAGVKLIKNRMELVQCLHKYPVGAAMMIQRLSDYEPEAGIFYVRHPDQPQGKIISMALKYMPYVIGDGQHTLAELIARDDRAGELQHLYQNRHQAHWHEIVPAGKPYRLIFSASHSKGAIFKDASHLITPELTRKLDALMHDIPDFHYGRLDVKFKNVDQLTTGTDLQIVEINTASSEPLHIWDSNTPFRAAVRSLLFQYRTLFELGHANRQQGHRPPGLKALIAHWRLEQNLTQFYPETD